MTKLLLGSGEWHWRDWVTVDGNVANRPDIVWTFPPLPAEVMAREWTDILASHVIEHLFRWEALALLQACHAILLPGGLLTLEQPNLDYCAKVLAGVLDPPEGRNRAQFGYWGIYGQPNGNPWDGHKAGYTPGTLSDLIVEAGFDRRAITIAPGFYHEPARDFQLRVTR